MSPRGRREPDLVVELMQDLERRSGYWLVVDRSEQSFVDLEDPSHLEFEYVQMMSYLIESRFPDDSPLTALHLGGGLCTVPRWIAELHPGSRQRIAENSPEIAAMARSLGGLERVGELVMSDALALVEATRAGSLDLLVCDVYDGPETITSVFTRDALTFARKALRPDGLYVCNLSDAAPFDLAKVVVATLRDVFATVVMLAEPGVLRGRRSGNLVLGATAGGLSVDDLTRRASGGRLRARVVADDDLTAFAASAVPAIEVSDLPPSGESASFWIR